MSKSAERKEYERGLREGRIEGYEYMLTLCYLKLAELGLTQDEIYKVHMYVNVENEKIRRLGREYFMRCKDRLADEYGIRFHWRKDEPLTKPIAPKAKPDLETFLKNIKGEN